MLCIENILIFLPDVQRKREPHGHAWDLLMNSDFDTLSSIVSSLTHTYTESLTIFYCLTLKKYMKITDSRDSNRCVYTHVDGSIIHRSKTWKQPRCPSTCEWINKMWCRQPTDY